MKLVTNPLAANGEMKRWAEKISRTGKNELEKALLLFDALSQRTGKGEISTLTAVEAFSRKDVTLRCQEQARLYVALARTIGLDGFLVNVRKDAYGREVLHQCAGIKLGEHGLLVDLSYLWFGASHREFEYVDDVRATALFLSQSEEIERRRIGAKLAPEDPWIQFAYLFALMSLNQWPEAAAAKERILKLDPNGWMASEAEALFAAEKGDLAHATTLLNRAAELNPDGSDIDLQLARVMAKAGRLEEAREHYHRTIQKAAGAADDILALILELSKQIEMKVPKRQ